MKVEYDGVRTNWFVTSHRSIIAWLVAVTGADWCVVDGANPDSVALGVGRVPWAAIAPELAAKLKGMTTFGTVPEDYTVAIKRLFAGVMKPTSPYRTHLEALWDIAPDLNAKIKAAKAALEADEELRRTIRERRKQ
jgi:hypothetical protein